ncbi:hypothetical protein, partial [Pseudomonas viridiflava]|uniref:hypothetical protein n=1 Tax=Pseudomonas viridiflava TaxID=33069 RepID=UPI00197D09C4
TESSQLSRHECVRKTDYCLPDHSAMSVHVTTTTIKQEVPGQLYTSLMTTLLNHLLEVAHHCADFADMPCFSAASHSVNRMPS